MRIIEKRWVDLHAGHRAAVSLERRLKAEWERPLQVVRRRNDRIAWASRGRLRKITGMTLSIFLLLCALLSAGMYLYPESRSQSLVYLCVLAIVGSLLGALYLFQRGSATTGTYSLPSMDLVEPWWKSLRPGRYLVRTRGERAEVEFLKSLAFLDDNHIAMWGLLTSARVTSDTDVLLLGPTGIWVFEVKYWSGRISRQAGSWSTRHRPGGSKIREKDPDQQWLDQKEELSKTIRLRLPGSSRLADLIKGGVVFAHPGAQLGEIAGHKAAYGTPGAWHKRIRESQPVEGLGIEEQLRLLDALVLYANRHEKEKLEIRSAAVEAQQLYENAAAALRKYVSERLE